MNFIGTMIAALCIGQAQSSGPKIGEFVNAFEPHHVSGPDAGTETCPVCKYGNTPAIQVWIPFDKINTMKSIIKLLDKKVKENPANLKAFIITVVSKEKLGQATTQLKSLNIELRASSVALTTLQPNDPGVEANQINLAPKIKNTVFVYKNRKVTAKWVDFSSSSESLKALEKAITSATK